ncbi:glycerol-3-phosphate dehydrogenase/oxidase [Fulvivirga sp. RKSG066]|nr:glycerol-3-phosphate dehydrogenase/oxidase [Fulvivirga aurantia]
MNLFNAHNRPQLIERLSNEQYDLLIIGGGVTGAGIALDAIARGLKVALLEKNDFASGTSSKSTKLIHGGLRYLKQFEIALVREVGKERAVVHQLAPHLVQSEKMLLPLIKGGTYGKILTSFGLMIYDVLAGVEKVDQRKMLSKEETMSREELLDEAKIEGGGLYAEYRTDDARLTIEIMKTAVARGAHMINYAEVTDFVYDNNQKISGISWVDNLTEKEYLTKAKYVISAAGPWVDKIREKNHSLNEKHLHLTKGVHIVIPHEKFPVSQSVYFDVPDGRMIFAIPRGRVTYVGTTDTDFFGDIDDVRTDLQDVIYLLDGIKHIFPEIRLTVSDVESSWAGLRPLIEEEGKSASELSRKDEIFESDTGLLSIAGGKLTGYRKMAERIVDKLARKIEDHEEVDIPGSKTENIVLGGGVFKNGKEVELYTAEILGRLSELELDDYYAAYLVSNYGRQTDEILRELKNQPHDNNELALILAELDFTIKNESVQTAVDFFERRTGRLFFHIQSVDEFKEAVLKAMQERFAWSDTRLENERLYLNSELDRARNFN